MNGTHGASAPHRFVLRGRRMSHFSPFREPSLDVASQPEKGRNILPEPRLRPGPREAQLSLPPGKCSGSRDAGCPRCQQAAHLGLPGTPREPLPEPPAV